MNDTAAISRLMDVCRQPAGCMNHAEEYVNAGCALIQLGRHLQKHYPEANTVGSQHDEDEILKKLLPGTGTYVDIGASHPVECSNTHRLYERGWRGLLIEPLPDCWAALLLERREDRLCPMAVSNCTGFATLRVCQSVSSLRSDWKIDGDETIPVRTDTLKNILAMYRDHDWTQTRFCSIDVEGHEKEVLEGIDWITFRPEVLCIEYRDYDREDLGTDNSHHWQYIVEENGYTLHHTTPINKIWIKKL